jgi:hypothetical protein
MQWQWQDGEQSARTVTASVVPVSPVAVRWLWKRISALLVEGKSAREAAAIAQSEAKQQLWITGND